MPDTRPKLKTRKFSTFHIELFEMILLGKTNREINDICGYTQRSHTVVDHTRKVMFKLLMLEELCRRDYMDRVIYPREYMFWWKRILQKHKDDLMSTAIKPDFYKKVP